MDECWITKHPEWKQCCCICKWYKVIDMADKSKKYYCFVGKIAYGEQSPDEIDQHGLCELFIKNA